MADGNTYKARMQTLDGIVRMDGNLVFNDSTSQPAAPAPPITSGTLPNTGAWVSGTAKVNPVSRAVSVTVEVVGDATNNIASCVIALSPDNSTFTTLATVSLAAAVNNTGAITTAVQVAWPQGWYVKLTLSHTTVAASIYY
jgi:hypothetical protein